MIDDRYGMLYSHNQRAERAELFGGAIFDTGFDDNAGDDTDDGSIVAYDVLSRRRRYLHNTPPPPPPTTTATESEADTRLETRRHNRREKDLE